MAKWDASDVTLQTTKPPNHQTTRNAQEYPEAVVGESDPEGEMEDASTTSKGP